MTSGPAMSTSPTTSFSSASASTRTTSADRDRLDAGVHPQRHRLHQERRGGLPDDLERGRPGADHHAGPHRQGRGRALAQHLLHLEARGDVRGELVLGDVGHQARTGRPRDPRRAARRRRACSRRPAGPAPGSRTSTARARGSRPRPPPRRPRSPAPRRWRPSARTSTWSPQVKRSGRGGLEEAATTSVARAQQLGDQAGADVAGRAGDEDAHLPSMATAANRPGAGGLRSVAVDQGGERLPGLAVRLAAAVDDRLAVHALVGLDGLVDALAAQVGRQRAGLEVEDRARKWW